MSLAVKINVALREQNCQKIGSERVNMNGFVCLHKGCIQVMKLKLSNYLDLHGNQKPVKQFTHYCLDFALTSTFYQICQTREWRYINNTRAEIKSQVNVIMVIKPAFLCILVASICKTINQNIWLLLSARKHSLIPYNPKTVLMGIHVSVLQIYVIRNC